MSEILFFLKFCRETNEQTKSLIITFDLHCFSLIQQRLHGDFVSFFGVFNHFF